MTASQSFNLIKSSRKRQI